MRGCGWGGCEEMVTTDKRMPIMPTRIPTRRVLGSAVCSGLTSISAMAQRYPQRSMKCFAAWHRPPPAKAFRRLFRTSLPARSFDDVQARIGARDTEDAAADDFDDVAEGGDVGDEFADLGFSAGQLHDVARRVGGQHLAADAAQQRAHRLDVLGRDLQFDQQQFAGESVAAGHVLDRDDIDELQQLGVDLRDDLVGADGDERDARHRGVIGGGHRQRLDVVAASGDETGNARERARFILKEYCYEMPHGPISIREGGTWAPGPAAGWAWLWSPRVRGPPIW